MRLHLVCILRGERCNSLQFDCYIDGARHRPWPGPLPKRPIYPTWNKFTMVNGMRFYCQLFATSNSNTDAITDFIHLDKEKYVFL